MARNLILTGGLYHPFEAASETLRSVLAEVGIDSDITTDIHSGLSWLADGGYELLTVYALRWPMLEPRFANDRALWAVTLTDADKARIDAHLAAGRGVLALHTAAICFDDWPRWREIVGAGWIWGTSNHPAHGPVRVAMTDAAHAITDGLPGFGFSEEAYAQMDLVDGIVPLATVQAPSQQAASPCLWVRETEPGRVVYDALGHDSASLEHPVHRCIVQRAALWATRRPAAELARCQANTGIFMNTLQGKSILITGGGTGIGAGCAAYFAARGALVTISGRRENRLREVADAIGPTCRLVVGDVTDAAGRRAMLDAALAHGGGKLDTLVNNAAITHHGGLLEQDENSLMKVLASNVAAPLLLTQAALPALEQSQGSVIFIGSVHTRLAITGRLAYAASKGAVQNMSRVLAAELGPRKVRVNCVIPGAVATEINAAVTGQDPAQARAFFYQLAHMHPIGRIGEPEDIAQAMEYLINASWTTGAVIDVDGGMGLGSSKL